MHTGHPHHWARMSAVLLSAALALTTQAGPLEPPVPPGTPTMRPIDQVDPRIPIYADDLPLTIDLMGFALRGGTGPAIATNSFAIGVTVRNGEIHGWSGAGVALFHAACVSDLIVRSNGGNGIVTGIDSRVVRCTADHNGLHGIVVSNGSIVSDCVANDNDENGIWVEPMGTRSFGTTFARETTITARRTRPESGSTATPTASRTTTLSGTTSA
jgi:hypothetical protein